jgi:Ser/Thr protein kinase RdoA (MazF antagonist)
VENGEIPVDAIDLTGAGFDPVQRAYDLGDWLDWRRAGEASWLVTTSLGRYVVRRSEDVSSAARIRFETELLEALGFAAYPAPRLVATGDGRPYLFDGAFYVVTEAVAGTAYDPEDSAHLWAAGRALANYHRIVRTFARRSRAQPRPLLIALEDLGPATMAAFGKVAAPFLSIAEGKRLSRAMSQLWVQFLRVPEALTAVVERLPQLVVHGSFGPAALVFAGERVAGVVGWESAGYERRVVDLAHAVSGFAGETPDLDRCAAFMAAYSEVEELAPHELAAVPLAFRAEALDEVLAGTGRLLGREGPHAEADVVDVVELIVRQAARTRWLEEHEDDLLLAMGGAALV